MSESVAPIELFFNKKMTTRSCVCLTVANVKGPTRNVTYFQIQIVFGNPGFQWSSLSQLIVHKTKQMSGKEHFITGRFSVRSILLKLMLRKGGVNKAVF